jgi:subtilase family serine protease
MSLVGASTTKIYLSVDNKYSSGDTELGSRAVSAFGAGAGSSAGSTSVTIPNTLPAGCGDSNDYIIVRADADGAIAEWNEGNNKRATAITIGP